MINNSKIVYSTDDSIPMEDEESKFSSTNVADQKVRIHLDRKVGGKIISVVKGLNELDTTLKSIAKELKKSCGVGGSIKKGDILIQGNQREKIQKILLQKGYNVKLSGG
tara:strand:- start:142 stop:468 length:327 start_codon:yes stop_codon:yes gene_type:complete